MVDFSKEADQQAAEQHSNGQQAMADQTPAPAPSQAAGAAAAAEAGAQQAAAAAAQQAAAQQPPAQPSAKSASIWDNLPESENYIKFTPDNGFKQRVQFIDNEPTQKPSAFKKDKMDYEFEVVDLLTPEPTVKTWSVSSIKLMRQLSAHLPLEGRIFDVQRVGEGLNIDYILIPVA